MNEGLLLTFAFILGPSEKCSRLVDKRLFRSINVPTADWLMAPVTAFDVEKALGWPAIVKPSKQGSTVG
jgi:D-alanine-D-alanine ligase-like ATP-grasp enzyme